MKNIYSFLIAIIICTSIHAQQSLKLVKDLTPGDLVLSSLSNSELISFNNEVYFSAENDSVGNELWKSDGTLNNTILLKDINVGGSVGRPESSSPSNFLVAGSSLFFTAVDSMFFRNLWKTDGTASGTQKVNVGQLFEEISALTALGNDLIFVGEEFNGDKKIWKTDGTSQGTVAISSNLDINLITLTELNGTIYFFANGSELWKTDGTVAGTSIVQSINSGFCSNLKAVGNSLYFGGYTFDFNNGTADITVWRSNGTSSGTTLIRTFTNTTTNAFLMPSSFVSTYLNKVLFVMDIGSGPGIYGTDGTANGTTLIRTLRNASGDDGFFTEFQGEAFFADSNLLWRTDLNSNSIVLVTDSFLVPGLRGEVFNNELYFNGFSQISMTQFQPKLWKLASTNTTPTKVKDVASGLYTVSNGELFFIGTDSTSGSELWKSDGTEAGTNLVKDIVPNIKNSSSFSPFYASTRVAYFFASGALWSSDGSSSGTEKVIQSGINSPVTIESVFSIRDSIYFRIGDTLFRTDGASANVSRAFVYPQNVAKTSELDGVEANGFVYYGAPTSFTNPDLALWRTDGTLSGTTLIKTLYPNSNSPNLIELNSMILVNGEIYFTAEDNSGRPEIWKTDGTNAGTVIVQSNDPNGFNLGSTSLGAVYNNELYVPAQNGSSSSGFSIWKINSGGATVVTSKLTSTGELIEHNGELYFYGFTATSGGELWKTDGTDLGTQLVKEINSGATSSFISDLTSFNGSLIFSAADGTNGYELWISDGTSANTVLLKDLFPGLGSGLPGSLQVVQDTLYFVANHPTLGREIWKTDGTTNGTVIRGDINPGIESSFPEKLIALDSVLLFVAENPNYGKELWRLGACQAERYTDNITACEQLSWIDGITYTNSNNSATFTVIDQFGCDSVVQLNLTILNSTTSTDVRVACDSLVWIDGNTYSNTTNSPTFTLTNSVGCDSIITLDLTIQGATTSTEFDSSCTAITWRDGRTYARSTTTPFITLTNSIGCDSIVNLNFTFTGKTNTINETACKSFTWIDGITYTASTDTPTVVFNLPSGCDSVIALNLTILPDITVSSSNDTLYANVLQARYQWLDCNNGFQPLLGDTLRSFYPDINGSYAVEVDRNGCKDTSECVITTVGLKENLKENTVLIYPNPSSERIFIKLGNEVFSNFQIFDGQGKLIDVQHVIPESLDVSDLRNGVYFIRLSNSKGFVIKRFMVLR